LARHTEKPAFFVSIHISGHLRTLTVLSQPTNPFEALRQSLELPASAMVGDALHFLIGDGMNVVVLMSDANRLLLLVELAPMEILQAKDWQRLVTHLSSHFDDDTMGRLMVLDHKLSMAWSHPGDIDTDVWVEQANIAMKWCRGARAKMLGETT
jgi:hypothetical protein